MVDRHKIDNLINYIACLSEPTAKIPETMDRLTEINKAVHELAHEIGKTKGE